MYVVKASNKREGQKVIDTICLGKALCNQPNLILIDSAISFIFNGEDLPTIDYISIRRGIHKFPSPMGDKSTHFFNHDCLPSKNL